MEWQSICDNIWRFAACENPLSADIVLIRGNSAFWLFDVGCGDDAAAAVSEALNGSANTPNVIVSHFHRDHMGNLNRMNINRIYSGAYTFKRIGRGITVRNELTIDDGVKLHIFPLLSSHAKGSLSLEIDGKYALLGDAFYSGSKNGKAAYNTGLLAAEIKTLRALCAETFILSHKNGCDEKENVINRLSDIYAQRKTNEPYIFL